MNRCRQPAEEPAEVLAEQLQQLLLRYVGRHVRELLRVDEGTALSRGIEPREGTIVDVAFMGDRGRARWRVRIQWPKRRRWLDLSTERTRWEVTDGRAQ